MSQVDVLETLYESRHPVRRYLHCRRRDVITEMIREHVSPGRIGVEIGPGVGTYISTLTNNFKCVVCVDRDRQALNYVNKRFPNIEPIYGDATRLPFADRSVHFVLCSEVLEHIPSPEGLLTEIFRIKTSKGRCVLSTPQKFSPCELTAKVVFARPFQKLSSTILKEPVHDPEHISLQTSSDLQQMLKDVGFEILQARYTGIFIPLITEFSKVWWAETLHRWEKAWEKGLLRPLLWTQIYLLQ